MILCAVLCGFEIAKIWNRWHIAPTIISFAQRPTRVSEIPFPAITVCPTHVLLHEKLNMTKLVFRHVASIDP
jgi:hypothetical protein